MAKELARALDLLSLRLELTVLLRPDLDAIADAALQLLDGDASLPQHEQVDFVFVRDADLKDSRLNTERAVAAVQNSNLALRILREVVKDVLSLGRRDMTRFVGRRSGQWHARLCDQFACKL